MSMTAPTEPVKAAPEALTDRLRRGAQFIESTLGDPVVLWSLESRESLASLLSVAAEALEARDDAAELRAAVREWASATQAVDDANEAWDDAIDAGAHTDEHSQAWVDTHERLAAAVTALLALAASEEES